jgi:PKD repeat protein
MKQKWGCVLLFCLFVYNTAAFATHERYLKHVATWKDYPYSSAFDMDMEHNVLYIGVGNEIRMHDANDLSDATTIHTITFEANVYDLLYTDGFLYVCNDDFGIFVYDVTNLEQPSIVYTDQDCLFARALHANDTYVVVVTEAFDSNLSIYQIESPNAIQLITRIQLSDLSQIESIHIQEQYVYVVDNNEGIRIYCFDDLLNNYVQPIGQYDNHSDLKHLLLHDQIAYISDRDTGFSIIDFSNPEMYQEYACIDNIQTAIGSVIVEQYSYVATHEQKSIWVLNIENPDNIEIVEKCPLEYEAYRIHAGNDHIFISSNSHMHIYQLTQGFPEPQFHANPRFGNSPLNVFFSNTSSGNILECKWDFGDGYTSTVNDPVHIYTQTGQYTVTLAVSNGEKWYTEMKANYISVRQMLPKACFEMDILSCVCPLTVQFIQKSSGNYTAVKWNFGDGHTSTEENPLYIFNTAGLFYVTLTISAMNDSYQYSQPVYVHNNVIPIIDWTSKPVYTLCIDSQRKYGFAGTADGIDILDIANPMAISIMQTIPLINHAESLFYSNDFLIAACGEGGINIFNTSNPHNISFVSQIPIDTIARHVWVKNAYAYISTDTGVYIYNLSAISSPEHITTIETGGEAYAMKGFGQYAFIVDMEEGLSCYKQKNDLDFSRPTTHCINNLVQFDFDMEYLFLAVKEAGMFIVKYNSTADQLVDAGNTKYFNALDICVRNDYAFIASDQDGFIVFDVQNKDQPKSIKQFFSNGSASEVLDVHPYIFLADGDGGLRIFAQPEQNQLHMQTPRNIHPGQSYQGQVCVPFVQQDTLRIGLQANHQITMIDESVDLTSGNLCRAFSFVVNKKLEGFNNTNPQVLFTASAKGWFDANSFSFVTENEKIKKYTASDVPLRIPDQKSEISTIQITEKGTFQYLSVQLKIQIEKLDDLKVILISPHNETFVLFEKVDPGEYIDTIEINFDDRAKRNISNAKIPLAGFYKPKKQFFNNKRSQHNRRMGTFG